MLPGVWNFCRGFARQVPHQYTRSEEITVLLVSLAIGLGTEWAAGIFRMLTFFTLHITLATEKREPEQVFRSMTRKSHARC